jgi:carboxylesterase
MKQVRKDLESGIRLPEGTYLKSYHSNHDPTANSASTVLIYKGVGTYSGGKIDVQIMESEIHVFTRLLLREGVTSKDYQNQLFAFEEMAYRLN